MALKKIAKGDGQSSNAGPGAEDALSWPNLWEHLSMHVYPDGSPRQTSSVIIVADNSGWRGCLSDKDNDRTLWRTASTVEGLLLALEEAAASDDPSVWRQAGASKWKGKKRG